MTRSPLVYEPIVDAFARSRPARSSYRPWRRCVLTAGFCEAILALVCLFTLLVIVALWISQSEDTHPTIRCAELRTPRTKPMSAWLKRSRVKGRAVEKTQRGRPSSRRARDQATRALPGRRSVVVLAAPLVLQVVDVALPACCRSWPISGSCGCSGHCVDDVDHGAST